MRGSRYFSNFRKKSLIRLSISWLTVESTKWLGQIFDFHFSFCFTNSWFQKFHFKIVWKKSLLLLESKSLYLKKYTYASFLSQCSVGCLPVVLLGSIFYLICWILCQTIRCWMRSQNPWFVSFRTFMIKCMTSILSCIYSFDDYPSKR